MSIAISVAGNCCDAIGIRGIAQKQVRFATTRALTDVARQAQQDVQAEMRKVFDNPTAVGAAGVRTRSADKTNLAAQVLIESTGGKGVRRQRSWPQKSRVAPVGRSDLNGRCRRRMMPGGYVAVPAAGAPSTATAISRAPSWASSCPTSRRSESRATRPTWRPSECVVSTRSRYRRRDTRPIRAWPTSFRRGRARTVICGRESTRKQARTGRMSRHHYVRPAGDISAAVGLRGRGAQVGGAELPCTDAGSAGGGTEDSAIDGTGEDCGAEFQSSGSSRV